MKKNAILRFVKKRKKNIFKTYESVFVCVSVLFSSFLKDTDVGYHTIFIFIYL